MPQDMAANVINSTTLGPRVAERVELDPDVCVCDKIIGTIQSKTHAMLHSTLAWTQLVPTL